jgi:hypothetical protein
MPIVSVNPATGEELARFQEHSWEIEFQNVQTLWIGPAASATKTPSAD